MECMIIPVKGKQISKGCIHIYQSRICCKREQCSSHTSSTMIPSDLLCEDCGNTLHKLCGTAIVINNQKEWICSECVFKNKTRNNKCCNSPLCKWHGNNTIGEPTCECGTCGQLIHSECIKEGKICNNALQIAQEQYCTEQ